MTTDQHERLDELIMSCVDKNWRKVALIAARVMSAADNESEDFMAQVTKRVGELVDAKKLEAQGDLSQPRNSEVRAV